MLQKARWGRYLAGLHSTLLRLWACMLSATSHCQQYLFKIPTRPLRANKLGAIGWCLLYKAITSSSLEPAAARNYLALQESFHACSSLWDSLIEGATNTYRSVTALITQQELINPNNGNRAAGATSYICQKSKACYLSALSLVHKVISKPWSEAFRTGNSLQDN